MSFAIHLTLCTRRKKTQGQFVPPKKPPEVQTFLTLATDQKVLRVGLTYKK